MLLPSWFYPGPMSRVSLTESLFDEKIYSSDQRHINRKTRVYEDT
jgi:hypothetical protein